MRKQWAFLHLGMLLIAHLVVYCLLVRVELLVGIDSIVVSLFFFSFFFFFVCEFK